MDVESSQLETGRWRRHVAALILPTLVAVASSVELVRDFRKDFLQSDTGDEVAVAKSIGGDVKRRSSNQYRWLEVGTGFSLFAKDSIRTTFSSKAVIELFDGGILRLNENSFVALDRSQGQVVLRLSRGSASYRAGENGLLISTKSRSVDVARGEGVLLATDSALFINIVSGKVTLLEGKRSREVSSEHRVEITDDGVVQVSRVPAILKEPDAGTYFVMSERGGNLSKVKMAWKPTTAGRSQALKLEISRSAEDFSVPVFSQVVPADFYEAQLPAGKFFWRVRGTQESGLDPVGISETRSIELIRKAVLPLLSPETQVSFDYGATHVFSWQGAPAYDSYTLKFAKDPTFNQVVKEMHLGRSTQAVVKLDVEGLLYWRIEADVTAVHLPSTSESRSLFVKSLHGQKPVPLSAPSPAQAVKEEAPTPLVSPIVKMAEKLFGTSKSKPSPVAPKPKPKTSLRIQPPTLVSPHDKAGLPIAKAARDGILLTWLKTDPVKFYQLEVSSDPDFKNILVKKASVENFHILKSSVRATYYWRVFGIKDAISSPASKTFRFTLK